MDIRYWLRCNMGTLYVGLVIYYYYLCLCIWGCQVQGCMEEERLALLQFKDSLNHNNHANNWVGDNCCEWKGVECDDSSSSTSRVVGIDISDELGDAGVEKWYPNATIFTHLQHLQSLNLADNNIGGWIMPQALCELHNLKYLDVSGNNLSNYGLPGCLGRALPYLARNQRNISSSLLTAFCGAKNLSLYLSVDDLTDESLPPCLLDMNGSSTIFGIKDLHFKGDTLQERDLGTTELDRAASL
ncbi:PREDICTED: DNA-damage-repair/toleration protein DRT100-like isoform X2 [Nelumbo nucifera]|uniref:DNA-damage-repair/toleration protein DRT100-like isoform X2 n=1 Tax=Nelumbo nucifera TaxID=4432 RepID=A0A1U7ZS50_NELNU|nr:PREDICTED: DNA-damage-repair/toleration protein DRT100-like isoform X2 [Nelumbo nucifera]